MRRLGLQRHFWICIDELHNGIFHRKNGSFFDGFYLKRQIAVMFGQNVFPARAVKWHPVRGPKFIGIVYLGLGYRPGQIAL